MTDLNTGASFVNETTADANAVNARFDAIETFLNSTGVHVYQAASIETAALENDAVTAAKLADGAIDAAAKIVDGTITAAKCASDIATQTELDAHINDSSAAHAASAISVSSTTLVGTGTDVQAVLEELDDAIADVVSGGVSDGSINTAKLADGSVTTAKLATGAAQQLGLTGAGNSDKRRGYVSIATEQTTTSTSFVELATPDEITSIVVPTGGLLRVRYMALWKLTGAGDGSHAAATIFIGSNQVKITPGYGEPVLSNAVMYYSGTNYGLLVSSDGDHSQGALKAIENPISDSSFVGTGLIPGDWGAADIYVDPGTYDVSIRFKVNATAGGTLSVKERQLWVESIGFA